jgi:hypothetical protein
MELPAMAGVGMRVMSATLCSLVLCTQIVTAQTHLLIVSGLGGDELHRERFHGWATAMLDAAANRYGISDSNLVYLAERVEKDPERIDGRSTKENVEQTLRALAERARANDEVLILLIGHGSYQGEESRFSLPGPDMTPQDFATALAWLSTQTVALVNTTSASGDFVEALSGERRTIITATRSPFERNETVFCHYFVEAFTEDVADVDHDERLSVLEAFEYARHEVARFYEDENRLLTEHAVLDDNGDGEGSSEPDPATSDGRMASSFLFDARATVVAELAEEDPYLSELYRRQRIYQDSLAVLRTRRDEMDTEEYEEVLERLLLNLSQIALAIRERGGSGL